MKSIQKCLIANRSKRAVVIHSSNRVQFQLRKIDTINQAGQRYIIVNQQRLNECKLSSYNGVIKYLHSIVFDFIKLVAIYSVKRLCIRHKSCNKQIEGKIGKLGFLSHNIQASNLAVAFQFLFSSRPKLVIVPALIGCGALWSKSCK